MHVKMAMAMAGILAAGSAEAGVRVVVGRPRPVLVSTRVVAAPARVIVRTPVLRLDLNGRR